MPEIQRLHQPDPRAFFEDYVLKGRPAVITGGFDWPILGVDPSTLIDKEREIVATEDAVGLFGPGHYKKVRMPFGEVMKKWESPPPKKYYYMDQQPVSKQHPDLMRLVGRPEYIDTERLVAVNLWMGEGRLRWHFDGVDNFLVHIHGRKRVRLMEPEKLHQLYVFGGQWSAIDDIDNVNLDIFPLAEGVGRPHDTILEKGEMLFIPAAWWHTTASLGNWGASVNFWYDTWYGQRKSVFERPFFSAIEHLTHLLAQEISEGERLHYCRYASEMIDRIARGNALPTRASGGWGNPRLVDFTSVRDRVPPVYPDPPR